MARPITPPQIRFHKHYTKGEGCWEWHSAIFKGLGYGKFNIGGDKVGYAHRFAYELFVGPIPEGMCVCHRCDNRICVNPEHLFVGTQRDNVLDMHAKGRAVLNPLRGSSSPNAKLTEQDVIAMRQRFDADRYGNSIAASRAYSISHDTANKILRRKRWKHL